jgi:hypothetical protein
MHQEPFLRPACRLVYRTQFREDVKRIFTQDISRGQSSLAVMAPAAITKSHASHRIARGRNSYRSVAQRRYEVNRRFRDMRTRGLTTGGVTVRI